MIHHSALMFQTFFIFAKDATISCKLSVLAAFHLFAPTMTVKQLESKHL